ILPRLISNPQVGNDIVLCHNDLYAPNVIFNAEEKSISFIDFDYTELNFALFDVASHFAGYCFLDKVNISLYPTREEQKRWLKIYFRARGMDESLSNDTTCRLIDQFAAVVHLMWGLWGLLQAHISTLTYDFIKHAEIHFGYYQKMRYSLFD
ncbi:unnamed protein product, partial [Rotaria sp. Silwood1]